MEENHHFDQEFLHDMARAKRRQDTLDSMELYHADPNCKHDVEVLWSGVKCRKCRGWYCA